jgi:hypothetical protein
MNSYPNHDAIIQEILEGSPTGEKDMPEHGIFQVKTCIMFLKVLTIGTTLLLASSQASVESTGKDEELPDLSHLFDDSHYDDTFNLDSECTS